MEEVAVTEDDVETKGSEEVGTVSEAILRDKRSRLFSPCPHSNKDLQDCLHTNHLLHTQNQTASPPLTGIPVKTLKNAPLTPIIMLQRTYISPCRISPMTLATWAMTSMALFRPTWWWDYRQLFG